jgi:hypothetical protein
MESMQQRDLFTFLPLDLLRTILNYLTMKEIGIFDNAILNDQSRSIFFQALHGFALGLRNKLNNPSEIKWLLSRRVSLTELGIQPCDQIDFQENCVALISQNRGTLRTIEFPNSYFRNDFFSVIILCPKLTSINFEGSSYLTPDAIATLVESQCQLTSLNLSRCQVTSEAINLISQRFPKLETLMLNNLRFVSETEVASFIQGCPQLRAIGLSGTSITDQSITAILEAYPNIELLLLENCHRVSLTGQFAVMRIVIPRHLMSSDPSKQLLGTQSLRRVLSDGQSSQFYLLLCDFLSSSKPSDRWSYFSWSCPDSCSISISR